MKKGSRQYLERERRRREMGILSDGAPIPADDGGDGDMQSERREEIPSPALRVEKKPETMGEAYEAVAPAIRNYRDRLRKEDAAKTAGGGNRPDEVVREAVRDHRAEFLSRCETPEVDTTGDGKVDEEDEPLMTPGMRRMARYI